MQKNTKDISTVVELFQCPKCEGELSGFVTKLICVHCKNVYPIKNGIIFLKSNFKSDVKLSYGKWKKLYLSEKKKAVTLKDAEQNSYIKAYLRFMKKGDMNGHFVDLGAGLGLMSLVVAKRFGKIPILIDFSSAALHEAQSIFKQNNARGIYICADITDPIYKKSAIGYFFSSMSLEYFKDIRSALELLYRSLTQNGMLLCVIPKVSLTTLTYHQFRSGDIPDVPFVKEVYEFLHLKIFKSKFLKTGYNISYRKSKIEKMLKGIGYKIIHSGDLQMSYQFALLPFGKNLAQSVVGHPWFSPLLLVIAKKR